MPSDDVKSQRFRNTRAGGGFGYLLSGYGQENAQKWIAFLQNEVKALVNSNHATIYNAKNLWKAEACAERLRRSSSVTLPANRDADAEYWGFWHVEDWNTLYARLFASAPLEAPEDGQTGYYRFSRLKALFRRFVTDPVEDPRISHVFDFRVDYHSEAIGGSERLYVFTMDIDEEAPDIHLFYRIVSDLDRLFPEVFLSAWTDRLSAYHFDPIFDIGLLTEYLEKTGVAFYLSQKSPMTDRIFGEVLAQYDAAPMQNGTWFRLKDAPSREPRKGSPANGLLIPQYLTIHWSSLILQKNFPVDGFDTVSRYYDRYSPTDPYLIFFRGLTPAQIDVLSKERGEFELQEQYPIDYLWRDVSEK